MCQCRVKTLAYIVLVLEIGFELHHAAERCCNRVTFIHLYSDGRPATPDPTLNPNSVDLGHPLHCLTFCTAEVTRRHHSLK